jgi:hypothetical protein
MAHLQMGRELLRNAETKIRDSIYIFEPAKSINKLLVEYQILSTAEEREAFVSALATRYAIAEFRLSCRANSETLSLSA